ncbi:hypothetical protein [Legionella sp. km772]|uniref:hypothetical protein n=1 Tax=Legionella sp. km772 TaxID=2498111 RepID=UPI000F8E340E|nr:hypothetical protein [Legionella sp. km772]RUR09160.1 hypothetical protein ELY15_09565 [Legionella sp. km772]
MDFKVYLEKFSDPKHFAAVVKNIHRLKLEIDKESELLNHLIEIDELMVLKIISGFIVQSKLDNKPAKLKELFNLYLVLLRQSRDGQDYASCFWLTLNLLKKDLSPYLDKKNQEKYYTKLLEFSHQPSIYLKMRRLLVIFEGSLHKKEFFELVFDDVALADFINYFSQVRLLDKNNEAEYLNFFKQYRSSLVAVKNQLSRLPPGLLNQNFFSELKRVCYLNQNNPLPAMQQFIRIQGNLFRPSLNDKQSTHKASVHASASHSAQRLKELYHNQLVGCSAQKEILALLEQDNSLKSEAIREFFKQCQHFTSRDSTSDISLSELLAYCWIAIHDDSQRQSSLEEARTVILEGLYEMQRGYNLNEQGEDNGQESSPICFSGCFNKFIEKLVGVHPVANIIYLDHQTTTLKFKALVLASLDNYLMLRT